MKYDSIVINGKSYDLVPTSRKDIVNVTEPVKHGHWREKIIYSHSYAECSECKTVYSWSETETMRYCKMCGAQMDEVEE